MSTRAVTRIIKAQPTSDGAGVRLFRTIGSQTLDALDPFLLLDEFKSDQRNDYLAGFPDHPHRGFETVTYMLAGSMQHKDHRGNEGNLVAGSVQWMTAGRGIIHSEMPKQDNGLMWGFQLWVNLPAAQKMTAPRYQDIPPENVPEVTTPDGVKIRVVAGKIAGVTGAFQGIVTEPLYLDVHVPRHTNYSLSVQNDHTALCYVFVGQGSFGATDSTSGQRVAAQQLAVLSDGEALTVKTENEDVRFLLLAGKPLREPIARYGPFVMNTREEIVKAFEDYQRGTFLD
ncbi:MAG: pirin family protein [Deltaproteobacteria bacterium]|nr:pirin family protein [Deltaproteobacteria bacterium]